MTTQVYDTLVVENITATSADFTLDGAVRLAIREKWIDLGVSAPDTAPDTVIATREDIKVSGGHMFQIIEHNGPLATIPQGTIPANGQKVYEYLYPQQYAKIIAGHQFAVTEVLWNSGVSGNVDAYKGCWSLGGEDEYGKWVRAPKLNADTNYRAPFLRGSQIGVDAGLITDDRIRDITGALGASVLTFFGGATGTELGSGVFRGIVLRELQPAAGGSGGGYFNNPTFAASRVVPTGPENSPRYHGVIMCIRMFGTVSNPGSLDAAQLATDLVVANAKIATLQAQPKMPKGVTTTVTRVAGVQYTNDSATDWMLVTATFSATAVNGYGTITASDTRSSQVIIPASGWSSPADILVGPLQTYSIILNNATITHVKETR